jgi:DeoR/GlpR family transcriptional regulator of sugar metabolism
MLAAERQQRILEMVLKSGAMTTAAAAQEFEISEETVRRDFEKLEGDGLIARKHGGALRLSNNDLEISLQSREVTNVAEKKVISQLALAYIQEGDSVFFDASSTAFYFASLLPNIRITVLTSGLKTAIELARRPAIRVILTGGIVGHGTLSCHGSLADSSLDRCHVQKAFMSCHGVDIERGLSEASMEQADLKRNIIKLTEQVILLVDHTKTSMKSSWFFAGFSDVDLFISDRKPPEMILNALEKNGVKLALPTISK